MARKPFLLRLDGRLYEELRRWAAAELRSVNGQVEFILRRAVEERKKSRAAGTAGSSGSAGASGSAGSSGSTDPSGP